MARVYANITTAIWTARDFCDLSSGAQLMYLMLVTQPDITACGTLPLTLRRWSLNLPTSERVTIAGRLAELVAARFVLVDEDTEELLVRKFIKWDGGYKHAKRVIAVLSTAQAIRSRTLLAATVAELDALGVEHGITVPTDSESIGNRMPPESAIGSDIVVVVTKEGLDPQPATRNPDPQPVGAEPARDADRLDVDRICKHLADRIEGNGAKRPATTQTWRDAARLMLDRDQHTEAQIHSAIDWCQDSEFWRSNILSLPKLRDQFDRLRLQAQARASPRLDATTTKVNGYAARGRELAERQAIEGGLT